MTSVKHLPVVARGTTLVDVIECCIKSSILWQSFAKITLMTNMQSVGQNDHNDRLLDVGSGRLVVIPGALSNSIEIPLQLGLYRIINLPDTGYQPDSEFKIRPDPDTGYRIPDSDIRICVKNRNSLIFIIWPYMKKSVRQKIQINCNNVLNCKFSNL